MNASDGSVSCSTYLHSPFWASKLTSNAFVVLFEPQNRPQTLFQSFLSLKIDLKCFCSPFWASKSTSNAFAVLFEPQNRPQTLLQSFLSLKIDLERFCSPFWASKSTSNGFVALFEPQNWLQTVFGSFRAVKTHPKRIWRFLFILKIYLECFPRLESVSICSLTYDRCPKRRLKYNCFE